MKTCSRKRSVRYKSQRHANGCCSAAIAMIADRPYDEVFAYVRRHFGKRLDDEPGKPYNGLEVEQMLKTAWRFGLRSTGVSFDRRALKARRDEAAIVIIDYPDDECQHAIVLTEDGRIFDPLPPRRREFRVTRHAMARAFSLMITF